MLRTALLVSALMLVVLPPAYAASPRSVDPRDFDIAGVKTGMDWNQALTAAAKHLQVAPSAFSLGLSKTHTTGAKLPGWFSYEKDGVKLVVYFEERVPFDKARPQVVDRIIYEIPDSKANRAAMEKAVLAKYGVPSNSPYDPWLWCARPQPMRACENQAELKYWQGGVQMTLSDPAWGDALQKIREDSKARKPNF